MLDSSFCYEDLRELKGGGKGESDVDVKNIRLLRR